MDAIEKIKQAIISGDWEATRDSAQAALDEGHKAHFIMNTMVAGMDIVGAEWQVGNMYIPEVMLAARALHAGLAIIRPFLTDAEIKMRGTVIIGTVQGDLHDIGKSLVAMMLEGASFEVHDLGVDVSPEAFVAAVKEYKPDIIGMSALLTTTLPYMRDVLRSLEEAGLRESVAVLLGGAPVTQKFADSIGADGYAPDGATAVLKARELVDAMSAKHRELLSQS